MMQIASRFVTACTLALAAGGAHTQPTPAPLLQIEPALIEAHQTSAGTNAQGVSPYYVDGSVDPYLDNRGTGLDGSLRSTAPFGWVVNANPYAHEWNDKARYRQDFLLNNGRYSPTHIDLALPAPGFSWTIGRTYSVPGDAPNYDVSYTGPAGYQGLDWHQFSQPEIKFSSDNSTYIYLVYGADRFLEFKLVDGSSTVYRGVNGAAGAIVEGAVGSSDEYDTLTYWDQHGTRSLFFDPRDSDNTITSTSTHNAQGQLWTITDAAGNQAYVGHATNPTTAITDGYDDGARIQVAYDTAGRKYEYTYTATTGTGAYSGLSADLLTKVEVFEDYDNDTVWETTGSKVEYSYFTTLESMRGIFGNLKEVHIQSPLTGYDSASPTSRVQKTKQRFWYQTNTSDDAKGYLKVYLNPEGYRRYELNETVSIDAVEIADSELIRYQEFYITNFFDYTGSGAIPGRIEIAKWPGEAIDGSPSVSSFGNINFDYYVYATYQNNSSAYDPGSRLYVAVKVGPGVGLHEFDLYFDEAGQPLTYRIRGDSSEPDFWTYVDREDPSSTNPFDGVIWILGRPLSIDTATENPTGSLYTPPCTLKSNTSGNPDGGVVEVFDREDSTTSAYRGFITAEQWQNGGAPIDTEDGPHSVFSYTYLTPVRDSAAAADVGGYLVIRPLRSAFKRHPDFDDGTGGVAPTEDTTYTYEFHAEDLGGGGTTDPADPHWLRYRLMKTTHPIVTTSQLGSGVVETTEHYRRSDGTLIYTKDESGIWDYTELDNNLPVKTIEDADLSLTSAFATGEQPADYIDTVPSTTGAYHLVIENEFDEVGRITERTLPTGRVQKAYHSAIASGEFTTVWSAKTSGTTHTGPAKYVAFDHLGHLVVDAEIAFTGGSTTTVQSDWLDDTAQTPLVDAVDTGEISMADTVLWDPSGSVVFANRKYFEMPLSGIGTRSINYDEQWFEYDVARRITDTMELNGTIRGSTYDSYGYIRDIILNSYDPSEGTAGLGGTFSGPGGISPGSCPESCCAPHMQPPGLHGIISWYLKGCGNQPVLSPPSIGDDGQTLSHNDLLGRQAFIVNPNAPHEFREFDNLGRVVAVGMYSDIPFTAVSTLPGANDRTTPAIFSDFDFRFHSPVTLATNRISLIQYGYTPRGQLFIVTRHEVDQSTGAVGEAVETQFAYDANGRLIYEDSGAIQKQQYNRIGQLTDSYTIAVSDDTAGSYSDLFDPDGDVVVSEHHAALDPATGNTHMHVRVDRVPDVNGQPQPVDALDGSDYSDISTMFVDASTLKGRVQITTYEFDDLDRVTGRSIHGTGDTENGTDFDPDTPSSGSLDVSLVYGDDGRIESVTDELGRVQTRSYDLAGKLTQTIDNYVVSGTDPDENRKTEWEYKHTQLYKYLAYLDATTSQVTTYEYGSPHDFEDHPEYADINPTNDLLREITYPDGGVEEYFYNNYGSVSLHVDRHGNEFVVEFDESKRPQLIRLELAASGFAADADKRIEILYNDRGMISTIEETDNSGADLLTAVSVLYDGWGAMSQLTHEDKVLADLAGGTIVKERSIGYKWETSSTSGPSQLRLDTFTFEGDANATGDEIDLVFNYTGNTNSGLSRVTSMALNGVTVADYDYIGLDRVSRIDYPQNDVYSDLQDGSNAYDTLDRFNRVTTSRWNKTRTSNEVPFYENDVTWDDGSNVTAITDDVFDKRWSFDFVNDDLDRLTQAKRGERSGGVISTLEEQEDWALGKVGTWESHSLDLNGDLDYADTGDFQRDNTFDGTTPDLGINQLELIEEDTDNTAGYENTYDRVYDDHGNLTDAPDRNQEYVWDYLNRLVEIKEDFGGGTGVQTVAKFRYNALGWRVAEQFDTSGDGYITSADTIWRRLIYDARWRVVEVYEVELDSGSQSEDLVERFVHHAAGRRGVGTGSYIDEVVLRERDTNLDGTLDERHYYCQNWRADVVAIIDDDGYQVEQVRYTPYGTPHSIPYADYTRDGQVDYFDVNPYANAVNNATSYDVKLDANLDGALDFYDISVFTTRYNETTGGTYGRGVQSAYSHEPGYAGYWRIKEVELSHVRKRWCDTSTGNWLSKDPAGYQDGPSLFGYVGQMPLVKLDPYGLMSRPDFPGSPGKDDGIDGDPESPENSSRTLDWFDGIYEWVVDQLKDDDPAIDPPTPAPPSVPSPPSPWEFNDPPRPPFNPKSPWPIQLGDDATVAATMGAAATGGFVGDLSCWVFVRWWSDEANEDITEGGRWNPVLPITEQVIWKYFQDYWRRERWEHWDE